MNSYVFLFHSERRTILKKGSVFFNHAKHQNSFLPFRGTPLESEFTSFGRSAHHLVDDSCSADIFCDTSSNQVMLEIIQIGSF